MTEEKGSNERGNNATGNLETKGAAVEAVSALVDSISLAVIGKRQVVQDAVLALIAEGHVLLEDVPGVGKTLLAKAIAKSISGEFKRVQFTADLLPSDITGVTMYSPENHEFTFRKGPVFTNILLGDEINRATPRTQSALLEAMEEQHVSLDGLEHSIELPFFVIATQNPVELEGTYPLPFAQMDRFIVRLSIGYLSAENEKRMLRDQRLSDPLQNVKPVIDGVGLRTVIRQVKQVRVEDAVLEYLMQLILKTRDSPMLEYGASPRGSLDLQSFSQAKAFCEGREFVLPDDVKYAARLVLPHRLIIKKGSRSLSLNSVALVDQIIESVSVPL